ncbi:hypothetical protein BDL97_17G109800 [Sphagnum fallax]|nr:hypothetical protein BDL97_17G109800 [Sphagnum fallax]
MPSQNRPINGHKTMKMWQIRTENWMGAPGATDPNTWQAFVFAPRDEWSVIKITLARYLPTWKGKIVESDAEMNAARVTGMGLSLTAEGGPEGWDSEEKTGKSFREQNRCALCE